MKKLMMVFLALILFALVCADGTPAEGSGTETDPYQIAILDNLLWLSTTEAVWDSTYYFLQTADIDASDTENWNDGAGFNPIGSDFTNPFRGNYNGGAHEIDGLYINRPDENGIGLFSTTWEALIENVRLSNVNITGNLSVGGLASHGFESTFNSCSISGYLCGNSSIGGLVGYLQSNSTIFDCIANCNVSGNNYVGGLVGSNWDSCCISKSYALGDVSGFNSVGGLAGAQQNSTISESYAICIVTGNGYVGGLVGYMQNNSNITESYFSGNVSGLSGVGGISGWNLESSISDCYANSSVEGESSVGGLVGDNHSNSFISTSYAMGSVSGSTHTGGFAGTNWEAQIENSIWNIETSGMSIGTGYTTGGTINNLLGKTTAEMQIASTYTDIGWDYVGESINGTDDIWDINNNLNSSYPFISELEASLNDNVVANFSADQTSGPLPLTVNFSDESISQSSTIVSWEWDFQNDGVIDSYEQNPVFIYDEQGDYSVSLTVSDELSRTTSTVIKEEYISVYCSSIQPDGSGTESDPYDVSALNNLLWISLNESSWNCFFTQTADIDASATQNWNHGTGFNQIGISQESPFQGTYLGNNHIIAGLYINKPNSFCLGLFGYTDGAYIDGIGVTNFIIDGFGSIGGIAGSTYNTTINNSYATGNVSGYSELGGLVGKNSNSTLNECYAVCQVSGSKRVGGLVGYNLESAINSSYAEGILFGHDSVGGIVGSNQLSTIANSYYDYQTTTINFHHLISIGALPGDLYNSWINNDMSLDITDYLSLDGENYLIESYNDLEKLLAFGQNTEYSFLLTNDIDLTDYPDFYIPYFAGSFNGDDHVIDGLNVNATEISNIGLFGYTNGAVIEALVMNFASVTGRNNNGALVGFNCNSLISKCFASGCVNGFGKVGGLVGWNHNSTISESSSYGIVSGEDLVGGLVGYNDTNSSIYDSFSTNSATGYQRVGGMVGGNTLYSTINRCYATGCVAGEQDVGGFVGWNSNDAQIDNCIWNTGTSNQTIGAGDNNGGIITTLIGSTTAEMQQMSTYTDIGWDFAGESVNGDEDIWDMDDEINDGYPYIYDLEFPVSNDEDEIVIDNGKLIIENYPNPFNPETNICFEIAESSKVLVSIYNIKGQIVETLIDGYLEAGKHSIIWNAENRGSGVYFIYYKSSSISEVKKIILLK